MIIGSSNAVNLTDGLDGLATVPVMLVALSFTLISYVVGNTIFAEYLQLQYIADVGEISIFCGSIVGSCLGFFGTMPHLLKYSWARLSISRWISCCGSYNCKTRDSPSNN